MMSLDLYAKRYQTCIFGCPHASETLRKRGGSVDLVLGLRSTPYSMYICSSLIHTYVLVFSFFSPETTDGQLSIHYSVGYLTLSVI